MSAQHNPFSALRDAARARRAAELDDASWVERAAGRLPPADEAALEAFAGNDPVVQHMRVVTDPATPAEQQALEARVLDALAGGAPRVVPLRVKRSRVIAVTATVLAAAAALLLLVRAPGAEPQLLPRYEGTLAGSDVPVRSAAELPAATRAHVSPGALVTLRARPVDVVPQGLALGARLFVVQGGAAARLDVPIELAATGAVRVTASHAQLFGARQGELDLLLFVGPPDALPDAEEASRNARAPGPGLQLVRFALRL